MVYGEQGDQRCDQGEAEQDLTQSPHPDLPPRDVDVATVEQT